MISGTIPLVEAMEVFKLDQDKIREIDAVNNAMIDYLKSTMTVYKKGDVEYINYPYSALRLKDDPDSSEDVNHLGFDSRDFQLILRNGRYDFNQVDAQRLANSMADIVIRRDGEFNFRLNGEGKFIKDYDYLSSLEALIWLAEYRPDLQEKIVEHTISKLDEKGYKDSYVYWEIMKLRERKQG